MRYITRNIVSLLCTLGGLGLIASAKPVLTIAQNSSVFDSVPVRNDSSERRLKIELSITQPEDLKVSEGQSVIKGQVLADRENERKRFELDKKQTELAIARIEGEELLPPPEPLPVAPIKPLPEANFAEEEARVSAAEMKYGQAQRNYNSALSIDPYISAQAEVNLSGFTQKKTLV